MANFKSFIAIILTTFICVQPALAESPIIWGPGGQAKALNAGGLTYSDNSTNADRGSPNMVANGSFEDPYVAGWITYNDGAAAAPVDGTGGVVTNITSLSQDTTTAQLIDGRGVGLMAKSANNVQGEGWSYAFTLPAKSTLPSSLVSMTFDYSLDVTSVTDLLRVYVYDVTNSTLITPQFVSCGGGATPSLASVSTCKAKLAFLASATGASYRLIFHEASTSALAVNFRVDNLYIGEYKSAVGAALGDWQSYTPGFRGDANGSSWTGITSNVGYWRRVGDSMEIEIETTFGTLATGTGSFVYDLPSGYLIDVTKSNATIGKAVFGVAMGSNSGGSTTYIGSVTNAAADLSPTNGSVLIANTAGAARWSATVPKTWASTDFIALHFMVPIATWANATSFGDNNVEYVYNSATGVLTDTTSFATGPGGVLVPSGAIATSDITRRVQFLTPISPTDIITLEVGQTALYWEPIQSQDPGTGVQPFTYQNGIEYGMGIRWGAFGTNTADVYFGKYQYASGATYGATGTNWGGGFYWRVKKARGGTAVGFGLATASNPGLYQAGSAPGVASSSAPCVGCVAEYFQNNIPEGSRVVLTTATAKSLCSFILTPGDWDVSAVGAFNQNGGAATTTVLNVAITTTQDSFSTGIIGDNQMQSASSPTTAVDSSLSIPSWRVTVASGSTTTIYLTVSATFASGSVSGFGRVSARRAR